MPGRNGTLTYDNGRYNNVQIRYVCGIQSDFKAKFAAFRAALPKGQYCRLEDTYFPDHFRLGMLSGGIEPQLIGAYWESGQFDILFDCKPQLFRKDGETPVTFNSPGALYNTGETALPLLTVYGSGSGTVTVGTETMQITAIDGYVVIDCSTQDAYKGLSNKNSTIKAAEFPELGPGENPVSWTGGVTKVEIIPRWWTL